VGNKENLLRATEEDRQEEGGTSRFPELDELQREIERRIRDNQRFLAVFMDDDFVAEEEGNDEAAEDDFEEL
jgi:hypothetical protein